MAHLDGDAARAARAETEHEPKSMSLAGKTYDLPNELPILFATAAARGEWEQAIRVLLNGRAEEFLADATAQDVSDWLLPALTELYVGGTSPGESSASAPSSRSVSTKSRRPTSAPTGKS